MRSIVTADGSSGMADAFRLPKETELAFQSRCLRAFFASATTGLALLDDNLRCLEVNDAFARVTGLSPENHRDKGLHEAASEVAVLLVPVLRGVLDTGIEIMDLPMSFLCGGEKRHLEGSFFRVEAVGAAGSMIGVILSEVTERKWAEEEIQITQQRLSAALEYSKLLFDTSPV